VTRSNSVAIEKKSMTAKNTAAQRRIRTLIKQHELQAAERILVNELAQAGNNKLLAAQCHSNLGNIAESQGRIGDAFRYWSCALALLERLGLSEAPEACRLRRLIRLWHENPRVWISYSHRDAKRVELVLEVLRNCGIDVLYDRNFLAGHSIQRQILTAISLCPKHVVFWSSHSRDSAWVQYEEEILKILKKQRRKDHSNRALDNIVIFYCLGKARPTDEMADDLQILESRLGFTLATKNLVQSIKTSEIVTAFCK